MPHWCLFLFLCLSFVFFLALVFVARRGLVSFNGKGLQIGNDSHERDIIRQQVKWAHFFITSLAGKINTEQSYNGYFTKYILERVYDEVVEWITFNHITTKGKYIEMKQSAICALVYSFAVKDEFKTPEFEARMKKWTQEVIEGLIDIRETYK